MFVTEPSADDAAFRQTFICGEAVQLHGGIGFTWERLSSCKMPRRLVVADRLPVMTTGKVDKRCVVAELSAAPDARASRISSNVTR
jgi:hypothetical protein